MNKTKYWLSLLAISVVLVAGSLAVSPIAIADDDDDDDDNEADFTLFTSRTDDFVTCSGDDDPFIIHIMATNVGETDDTRVQVIFTDGDSIPFEVPDGTTVGFSQVAGTGEFDSTIIIDPEDNDGDVNPIVMWVSVIGDDVVCDFESLP